MLSVQIEERRDENTILCRVKWKADSSEVAIFHVLVSATVDEVDDYLEPSATIRQAAIVAAQLVARQFAAVDA